jgi:hypothetical protein
MMPNSMAFSRCLEHVKSPVYVLGIIVRSHGPDRSKAVEMNLFHWNYYQRIPVAFESRLSGIPETIHSYQDLLGA